MQTTIPKPSKRQEPSEVNGQHQSQVKPKPKAMSHKPSEAKWSQVKPSEAKWSQVKPSEAKWSQVKPSEAKWSQVKPSEAKSKVGTQMGDSSSKMHAKHRF